MTEIKNKAWGFERWIINTKDYCGKILHLKKDHQSSYHMHPKKDETFYISEGKVRLEFGNIVKTMEPGDFQRILPHTYHRFTGIEDSIIIEFSTSHSEDDVVRKTKSGKIETYCFDICGAICSIELPEDYDKAKPFKNRIDKINKLYDEGHTIYFLTSRHMQHEQVTKRWLQEQGVKYHHIFFGKPLADKYIDDKGENSETFFRDLI